ncbi:MAG TPA: flagellar basal body-associated FliL family protein [bacterium]|nr:flagellar basal body-associated FliL family protein [bacterium]
MADQGEKGLRGLVMISLLLSALTLVGMAVLGVLALTKLGGVSESKKEVKVIEQKPEPGKNYDLGTFTVNLADEEASRYVRAHVVMEYSSLNPELDKEIKLREAQFKDLVNTLLNDRKAVELSTAEGKEQFRREFQLKVNETLKYGAITNVFLTEFAIQ